MYDLADDSFYSKIVQKHIHPRCQIVEIKTITGGCINNSHRIITTHGDFFIKYNPTTDVDFFEKESAGLFLLKQQEIFSIPAPIGFGSIDQCAYLILEFTHSGKRKPDFSSDLGAKLAVLHKVSYDRYGFHHDNYIGSLPQKNTESQNWITFFIHHRLIVQIDLAVQRKLLSSDNQHKFEKLFTLLPDILVEEKPSLLHGDLWSGNVMSDSKGNPCLVDPAVYFGHRELELAFTNLFGGFDKDFYSTYHAHFPLVPGYEKRIEIYHLYPLLVHVNLFGAAYLPAVNGILKKYIR